MSSRLGVVEIAGGIRLQTHREFVEVIGHLVVVVEALEPVDLLVAVQVVQDRDLIAAYIHYAIAAAQAPAVTAYHQEFNTQAAKARVTAAMNRSQVDFAEKKLATMPK